jgi:transposase
MNRIPKAVYTKEFREEAVKLAMTEGVGVSEAARRLSISMKTLANWVRAAKAGKLERVGQHQKPLTEIEAELGRVKRELAEVKMERDLLKNSRRTSRGSRGEVRRDRTDATGLSGAADVPAAGRFRERLLRVAQALAVVAGTAGAATGGRGARCASAHA